MRSLYTNDIPGTKSRLTIFQKSSFKQKYHHFAKSNEKNPQHQKYEWYIPQKYNNNDSNLTSPRYTLKLMSQHTGISKSQHFQQFKKVNQLKSQQGKGENTSSVFLHSGRNSVSELKPKKETQRNPYFPHIYEDYNHNRKKWSGNRQWNYDKPQKLSFAEITKSKLFSYI